MGPLLLGEKVGLMLRILVFVPLYGFPDEVREALVDVLDP